MSTVSVNFNFGGRKEGKSTQIVDCVHDSDSDYSKTGGIDISTNVFEPKDSNDKNIIMNGLLIEAGSGDIAFEMEGGGEITTGFTTVAGDSKQILTGCRIKKIQNTAGGTTYSGNIFPLF